MMGVGDLLRLLDDGEPAEYVIALSLTSGEDLLHKVIIRKAISL